MSRLLQQKVILEFLFGRGKTLEIIEGFETGKFFIDTREDVEIYGKSLYKENKKASDFMLKKVLNKIDKKV